MRGKTNTFVGLDVLKTVAVIGVILNHTLPDSGKIVSFLYSFGIYMAVPVFMVISGFLFSYVSEKKHTVSVLSWFRPNIFLKRLFTYALPFFIILAGECFFLNSWSVEFILKIIPTGGVLASGSYYIPVFFQFLICFPFLYKLSNRPNLGTAVMVAIWFLFECGMVHLRGGAYLYRLCFLRYLPFVWGGILLWRYPWFINLIPKLCVLSLLYITLLWTHSYQPSLFFGWHATSGLTAGYAVFLVWLFLKVFQKMPPIPYWLNIGRATWFIFLFQMFFLKFLRHLPFFSKCTKTEVFFCCFFGGILFFYAYELLIFLFKKTYSVLLTRKNKRKQDDFMDLSSFGGSF